MSNIASLSKKENYKECHWCDYSWICNGHSCWKDKDHKAKRKTFIKKDTKRQIEESENS